jgi:D-inositol-3-phosphate glycosyltransferase
MKIAMISYWSCPLTRLGVLKSGGMNVYILHLVHYLARLGHDVDVYTRTHKGGDENLIKLDKNARIIHLSAADTNSYTKNVLQYIKKHSLSYNIIHAHYYYSGLIGCGLKKELPVPLVMTFHTLGMMKKLYLGINDKRRINFEKKVVSCVDGIIASTDLEAVELMRYYQAEKNKIFVVPPGVNHHVFKKYNQSYSRSKLKIDKNKRVILFIGRIDPVKKINLLIEAVAKLTKIHPSFINNFRVFLIGGDIGSREFWHDKEVKKIKYLIGEKNLECCVKFIGSQPYNLLPFYYSAADVVVMPSVYESLSFVVLEALACGSTVLASRVGGMTFLIRDKINGRHFESNDYDSLSSILWELLNDKKQRAILSKNAIVSTKNYCWEKQVNKMLSVYKKLL